MVLERIANPSSGESRFLSSSLSRSAKIYSPIAQLVERLTVNQNVPRSSRGRGAKLVDTVKIILYNKIHAPVTELVYVLVLEAKF